jgi:hypothetical protein
MLRSVVGQIYYVSRFQMTVPGPQVPEQYSTVLVITVLGMVITVLGI